MIDIHKVFNNFCKKKDCTPKDCKYFFADDCESSYIIDLLKNNKDLRIKIGRGNRKG